MSKHPPRITSTPVKWLLAIIMAVGAGLVWIGAKGFRNGE